jgi:hypothetical protein
MRRVAVVKLTIATKWPISLTPTPTGRERAIFFIGSSKPLTSARSAPASPPRRCSSSAPDS